MRSNLTPVSEPISKRGATTILLGARQLDPLPLPREGKVGHCATACVAPKAVLVDRRSRAERLRRLMCENEKAFLPVCADLDDRPQPCAAHSLGRLCVGLNPHVETSDVELKGERQGLVDRRSSSRCGSDYFRAPRMATS